MNTNEKTALPRTSPAVTGEKELVRDAGDRAQAPRERYHFGLPQGKLQVWNQDPEYHYHWINDTPGRVEMALASGYEFVSKGSITLLPGVTPKDSDPGERVSTVVGSLENSAALRAYLMRTPLALYEENQRKLQERSDAMDTAIRSGRTTGQEGGNFYVPSGTPIRMANKLGN